MRVEITNGKVSVHMDNGQVYKMPETNKVLKEARKYKKRRAGIITECELCNKVFASKAGCSIHKHYMHPVK